MAAALGAGGMLAAAAAVVAGLASLHRASLHAGHVTVAGLPLSYPTVNRAGGLLLFLALLGAAVMKIAVRTAWRQRQSYRRFVERLAVVGTVPGDRAATVIADPRPQAFCAGYLRPTVYVSELTLELLDEAGLAAVLAHEHHHRYVRDPLRFACGRVLSQAVFFVPALRSLCERYEAGAELSADAAAIRASHGDTQPLASALLAFDENGPPEATGISPERVDSLLGETTAWRLPRARVAASIVALSTVAVALWLTSAAASAHATFNLPFLSSQPCIVMTMLVPCWGCLKLILRRRGGCSSACPPGHLVAYE